MFSRSKKSTTTKIEVISTLWSALLIGMLASTVTLYDSSEPNTELRQQAFTLSAQQPVTQDLR